MTKKQSRRYDVRRIRRQAKRDFGANAPSRDAMAGAAARRGYREAVSASSRPVADEGWDGSNEDLEPFWVIADGDAQERDYDFALDDRLQLIAVA